LGWGILRREPRWPPERGSMGMPETECRRTVGQKKMRGGGKKKASPRTNKKIKKKKKKKKMK